MQIRFQVDTYSNHVALLQRYRSIRMLCPYEAQNTRQIQNHFTAYGFIHYFKLSKDFQRFERATL